MKKILIGTHNKGKIQGNSVFIAKKNAKNFTHNVEN